MAPPTRACWQKYQLRATRATWHICVGSCECDWFDIFSQSVWGVQGYSDLALGDSSQFNEQMQAQKGRACICSQYKQW